MLSKLRFFGLRRPKTTSFYSTSLTKNGDDKFNFCHPPIVEGVATPS